MTLIRFILSLLFLSPFSPLVQNAFGSEDLVEIFCQEIALVSSQTSRIDDLQWKRISEEVSEKKGNPQAEELLKTTEEAQSRFQLCLSRHREDFEMAELLWLGRKHLRAAQSAQSLEGSAVDPVSQVFRMPGVGEYEVTAGREGASIETEALANRDAHYKELWDKFFERLRADYESLGVSLTSLEESQ